MNIQVHEKLIALNQEPFILCIIQLTNV